MSDLASLQRQFASAITSSDPKCSKALVEAVNGHGLQGWQRIQVHCNNYAHATADALLPVFPVTQKFVGEDFLRGLAREYMKKTPPSEPCLFTYGGCFADFLETFNPVQAVPYVPDLVRLEWAVHDLQNAEEYAPVVPPPSACYVLSPNVRVVDSRYPVLALWMAGTGQLPPEAVHLGQGGQTAAIVLRGGQVLLQSLEGELRTYVLQMLSVYLEQ